MYNLGRIYELVNTDSKTFLLGSTTIMLSQQLAEMEYNRTMDKACATYKELSELSPEPIQLVVFLRL